MKPFDIRGVKSHDLPVFVDNLRAADIREIVAATGSVDIKKSLGLTIRHSDHVFVAYGEKSPLLMFGSAKRSDTSMVIWAVGTPFITDYSREFISMSRELLKTWFQLNPEVQYMWNFTYAENTLHHRWLKWCGAELLPPISSGPRGERFIPFVIKRTDYDV
ncbi:hypothetical protein [Maritalea mediterranea]|uniref:Internal virion protein A n=1 Tax=Maritalea mediterranea TaxID=2909667 RepID=A0ABS9EA74_9HYPH|nr:hypothetical protein [Maritalea mediterranea]MCF4099786.1 hypothetical protein [Maritalea mediterranea]